MRGEKGAFVVCLLLAILLPVSAESFETQLAIGSSNLQSAGVDSGGPDGFGYRWISSNDPGGPTYSWIDITAIGTPTGPGNQWNSGLLSILPTPFWFYGNTFTNLAICDNGWVSFTDDSAILFPDSLPDPSGYFNCIAGLAANIDPEAGGEIYYLVDSLNDRTIVEWFNTPHFGSSNYYTFEIIINCADSTILLQYDNSTNWTAFPTVVGIQNSNGTIGLTVPQDSLANSYAVKFYWVSPDSNVGMVSIDYPNDAILLQPSVPCTIKATVENCGTSMVSFDVICDVDSLGLIIYTDTEMVSNLAGGSTAQVQFPDWAPAEFFDYAITLTTLLPGDPFPFNDTKSRRAKAPGPYYEELHWDSLTVFQFYYYPQHDSVMAVELFPSLYPALIKYVAIYLLSEGDDPYWPYPDSTHDPIGVGIWFDSNGDTIPDTLVYADTIMGDSIPPSWVYGVPPDSLIIYDSHFWVGMNNLGGGGEEALGLDGVTDYPQYKWTGSYTGVWYRGDPCEGDRMIRAYVSPAVEHDVGAIEIVSPGPWVPPNTPLTPSAVVANFSVNPETFLVYCLIDSVGANIYRDSVTVTNLAPFDSTQVDFIEWTPDGLGNTYDITVYTALDGDQYPPNDTVRGTTYTFEEITEIPSGWAFSPPTIDGFMDATEWESAFKVDISDIYGMSGGGAVPPGYVYAHLMNDSSYLYLGFDCIHDSTYNQDDQPVFFLDDNQDGSWPLYPDTTEGLNNWVPRPSIRWSTCWICADSGWGDFRFPRIGLSMDVSDTSGRMQFEGALPLGDSIDPAYLDAQPSDTVGLFLSYYDDLTATRYGWWPQMATVWDDPSQYGDLILAACVGIEETASHRLQATSSTLEQNYPNPFTRETQIAYSIWRMAEPGDAISHEPLAISLRVYDVTGRLVRTLADGEKKPGLYKVNWDGRDDSGRAVSAGLYFYRLAAHHTCGRQAVGGYVSTKKLVLLR